MPTTAQDDQLDAACRDAEELTRRLSAEVKTIDPGRGWSGLASGRPSPEAQALILGALRSTERCQHLVDSGPQPAIVMLATHRADCVPCSRRWSWPPLDEDDRCDFGCGARGVKRFTPVAIQLGPYLIIGDACGACAPILRLDATA